MKRRQELVIATRESPLALWQAEFVKARLQAAHPGLKVSLLGMRTQGDRWLQAPLAEVGGKGLFIKELEQALLDGRADLAVHSMKDVPAELPPEFVIPVIGFRGDVRDALVSRDGLGFDALPRGARIGSSSLRRQAQLLARRPDLRILPVRGNVGTRLGKLDAGDYDALVLACAGLERLELTGRITERFAIEDSVPAGGQGALGVECRADADAVRELLAPLDDPEVSVCVRAERAVSAGLGADCSAPLGAHARRVGEGLELVAVLASADGRRVLRARASGSDPQALAAEVVESLCTQGAAEILGSLGGG
ncbi:MAG TPA: hydroxymethylbilane synthase [Pseudomonadales bacterium]